MSRARLGLAVARHEIRAVVVRHGRPVWHSVEVVNEGDTIDAALDRLLLRVPHRRIPRLPVTTALGHSTTQVKRLAGLPSGIGKHEVAQVVGQNVHRYFLRTGTPLRATVTPADDQGWWGAALDESLIQAVERACERAHLRLDGCAPAAALLDRVFGDGIVVRTDGAAAMRVVIDGGRWIDIRRVTASNDAIQRTSDLRPESAIPGDCAHEYAEACAAARSGSDAPLLRRPAGGHGRRPERVARAALVATLALAVAAFVAAPGVAATRAAIAADARLAKLTGQLALLAGARYDLQRVSAGLEAVARFSAARHPVLPLLGAVSFALPESSAIAALRLDSLGGTVTILSSSGPLLVGAMSAAPGIEEPRLAGVVSRENVGGAELQRVTLRFRRAAQRVMPP